MASVPRGEDGFEFRPHNFPPALEFDGCVVADECETVKIDGASEFDT